MSEINLRQRSNRSGSGAVESSEKLVTALSEALRFLRSRLTTAASKATMPVFFLQAENDHDLTPNRVLSEEVRKAGKPVEAKVYPAFGSGPREGHSFCLRGTEIWFPDVLRFIETHLK
jgi:carboxymethylenebutenolidase